MKTRLLAAFSAAGLLAIVCGLIFWSCQKEKHPDDELSAAIAASSEMEQYIISGYEMQAALNEFQKALNTIDFSKLEFVPDADGKQVMHLPVQSLTFEAKLNAFNDRKRAMHRRFPQLTSLDSETRGGIISSCVQHSETVATKLLDMGINAFLPRTKARNPEWWMDTEDFKFLKYWSAYSGDRYVEALMIVFADGRTTIYISPDSTPIGGSLPYVKSNGNAYFANDRTSPIRMLIHTHSAIHGIAPEPSSVDKSNKIPGVDNIYYGILYQGTVRPF